MILLRDDPSRGLQLLMLRRGESARFMPGVWVFAGGAVDPEDRASGFALQGVDPEDAAHRACAARELGEEASVPLAPEALRPWSRWVTPEVVPTRFDTRFYVARADPDCPEPAPDMAEIDAARWVTPAAALQGHAEGGFELPFPTLKTVEELGRFADADSVLAEAAGRDVEAVTPQVQRSDDDWEILLPGDPGFDRDR